MTDHHSIILNFQKFIVLNWAYISELDTQDESDALRIDWLQANWEILVEQQLRTPLIMLEVYGDGADNGQSSRIQNETASPTHYISCEPKSKLFLYDHLNKEKIHTDFEKLRFDRFASLRSNDWYYEEPPFDKVLFYRENRAIVLNLSDIKFTLEAYIDI